MTTSVPSPEFLARPYRLGVGVMLINRAGRVFVAERIDTPGAWQMPQGGIDAGEDPRATALRELKEEIGTDKAELIGETRNWLTYDLPPELAGEKIWGGRYRGQKQKWFAMRFLGTDCDIDLAAHGHPEFRAYRWVPADALVGAIVPFKRDLYQQIVTELGRFATPC
jgi:putative (di)nucleoside polyphosphate hydrolase